MSKDIDWPRAVAAAAHQAGDQPGDEADPLAAGLTPGANDAEFLAKMKDSPHWRDLDLILRTLQEMGAHPLVFCTPINSNAFPHSGLSRAAREIFHQRLAAAVAPYHFTLRAFPDHDTDRHFEVDRFDHLSEKGWLYYNRALDAFVHERAEEQ